MALDRRAKAMSLMMATGLIISFFFMFGRRKGKKIRLTKLGMSVVFVLYTGFAYVLLFGSPTGQQNLSQGTVPSQYPVIDTEPTGPRCPEMQKKLDVDQFASSQKWRERKADLEKKGVKDADSIVDTYRETGSFLPRSLSQKEEFQGRIWGEELFEKQAKRDEDLLKLPISEVFYKVRRWAGTDFNVRIFTWFLSNIMDAWKHEWVELLECRARKRKKWEWSTDENWMFQHQDARALHSVVRAFKPKRVVEIGSGYSTRIGAGAMELNKKDGHEGEYLIIEPFPGRVPDPLPGLCRPGCIIKDFMEKVPLKHFTSLESGDMLFIDSSHLVGKHHDLITGLNVVWRDVAIEFTELVPRLKPGVIVHVHDIPFPLPVWYQEKYYIEQFMVQALLQDNPYLEPLWFGGAAAAPFHEADGMSLLEWEGLQLELERVFDMQDEKAPVAFNGRKLTDKGFSFQGGGSIYFRRTSKEYPGRDECPGGGKIETCEVAFEQMFDRHRSWGLMGNSVGNDELKAALNSVKLSSEATQDALLCAAIKTYGIARVIEICQGAGGPSKGGPVPTGCLTLSTAGQGAAEFIACGESGDKTDVKQVQLSSATLQDFHAYGGDGGMVLFKFSRAIMEARHPNDSAIAFISEVIPRLKKGTLVVILGVPFPAHKNFDSNSKYGDAAQMLVQAALMDNPKYSVELVRDMEMVLRRV